MSHKILFVLLFTSGQVFADSYLSAWHTLTKPLAGMMIIIARAIYQKSRKSIVEITKHGVFLKTSTIAK